VKVASRDRHRRPFTSKAQAGDFSEAERQRPLTSLRIWCGLRGRNGRSSTPEYDRQHRRSRDSADCPTNCAASPYRRAAKKGHDIRCNVRRPSGCKTESSRGMIGPEILLGSCEPETQFSKLLPARDRPAPRPRSPLQRRQTRRGVSESDGSGSRATRRLAPRRLRRPADRAVAKRRSPAYGKAARRRMGFHDPLDVANRSQYLRLGAPLLASASRSVFSFGDPAREESRIDQRDALATNTLTECSTVVRASSAWERSSRPWSTDEQRAAPLGGDTPPAMEGK